MVNGKCGMLANTMVQLQALNCYRYTSQLPVTYERAVREFPLALHEMFRSPDKWYQTQPGVFWDTETPLSPSDPKYAATYTRIAFRDAGDDTEVIYERYDRETQIPPMGPIIKFLGNFFVRKTFASLHQRMFSYYDTTPGVSR
jgi:hypothetical protein